MTGNVPPARQCALPSCERAVVDGRTSGGLCKYHRPGGNDESVTSTEESADETDGETVSESRQSDPEPGDGDGAKDGRGGEQVGVAEKRQVDGRKLGLYTHGRSNLGISARRPCLSWSSTLLGFWRMPVQFLGSESPDDLLGGPIYYFRLKRLTMVAEGCFDC